MNELTINGFSAVSEEEMMMVDGGGWKAFWCAVGGGILGALVAIPTANPITICTCAAIGVSAGAEAGIALEN